MRVYAYRVTYLLACNLLHLRPCALRMFTASLRMCFQSFQMYRWYLRSEDKCTVHLLPQASNTAPNDDSNGSESETPPFTFYFTVSDFAGYSNNYESFI